MVDNFDLGGNITIAELNDVRTSLDAINLSSERVARSLSRTFATAIVSGKSFEDTLRSVGLNLLKLALTAGLQPLFQGASSAIGSAFSAFTAGGGSGPSITPFAEGGVVSRPTFFGSGGGLGLMGERGAEAILPLARGPDGRLGIASQGAGNQQPQVNVTISTPDADSFRRSQVELSGILARAVLRGHRSL